MPVVEVLKQGRGDQSRPPLLTTHQERPVSIKPQVCLEAHAYSSVQLEPRSTTPAMGFSAVPPK